MRIDKNGHYAVVGLGASGLSAARYLCNLGCKVSVTDAAIRPKLAAQLPDGVACFFGGVDGDLLRRVDGVVLSPGVDPTIEPVACAVQAGVWTLSDVQLFADEARKRGIDIVAITGSNAKSTVTALVGQMAKDANIACGVGGNIGTPALDLLALPMQLAVLELSSFQLEGIRRLGAAVATILNVSADHLDRHKTMDNYLQAKLAIFEEAKAAVLGADDPTLLLACQKALPKSARQIFVGGQNASGFGLVGEGKKRALGKNGAPLLDADALRIKGEHNLSNALFALAIGEAVGLPMASMLATLRNFAGLPHRCQYLKTVDGCAYFDDSKATNVGAAKAAIEGLGVSFGEKSLALILGGQAKGQRFDDLRDPIAKYGRMVLTVGVDAPLIEADLAQAGVPIIACHTLQNATQTAYEQSKRDPDLKATLLSPACASFDQFEGFAHRGEVFARLVEALG